MKLSTMQANAQKLVTDVMRRYQDALALDGNQLVDRNSSPGEVDAQIDGYQITARSDAAGNPVYFKMESRQELSRDREYEASERRNTYEITQRDGNQVISYEYHGPDRFGGGCDTTERQEAIVTPGTLQLIDYEEYHIV
ncbi:MAG: hypothetical protein U0931_10865 [Vulcanimicrobiota bacterium]